MAQQQTNKDTRPKVAVYGLVRSERDSLGQILAVQWAITGGYKAVEYVDKATPCPGKPSAWDSLLQDIAKGAFYGVVMWQDSTGMIDYCSQHNTGFLFLDNVFGSLQGAPTGRKVRLA
jgi:hypothetical protein